jgi:hypothetical protein
VFYVTPLLDRILSAKLFHSRKDIIAYALKKRPKGHILELGVHGGVSLRMISGKIGKKDTVYGFDSFEGLPEEWPFNEEVTLPKGRFACPPPAAGPNAEIVVGWIEDTLPEWLGQYPGPIAFVHFDLDIYESTATGLRELNHRFRQGTILLFDELVEFRDNVSTREAYAKWREGEWKALLEWLEYSQWQVEPIARDTMYRVALRVEDDHE